MSKARTSFYALVYAAICAVLPITLLFVAQTAQAQATGATGYTLGDVVALIIVAVGVLCAFKGFQTGRMR